VDPVVSVRRLLMAQMALLFGPERLRAQLARLMEGELDAEAAEVLRADLDAMAGLLIGG
jgi:hypothetical protein